MSNVLTSYQLYLFSISSKIWAQEMQIISWYNETEKPKRIYFVATDADSENWYAQIKTYRAYIKFSGYVRMMVFRSKSKREKHSCQTLKG